MNIRLQKFLRKILKTGFDTVYFYPLKDFIFSFRTENDYYLVIIIFTGELI